MQSNFPRENFAVVQNSPCECLKGDEQSVKVQCSRICECLKRTGESLNVQCPGICECLKTTKELVNPSMSSINMAWLHCRMCECLTFHNFLATSIIELLLNKIARGALIYITNLRQQYRGLICTLAGGARCRNEMFYVLTSLRVQGGEMSCFMFLLVYRTSSCSRQFIEPRARCCIILHKINCWQFPLKAYHTNNISLL